LHAFMPKHASCSTPSAGYGRFTRGIASTVNQPVRPHRMAFPGTTRSV
jgi:hypothetical protein